MIPFLVPVMLKLSDCLGLRKKKVTEPLQINELAEIQTPDHILSLFQKQVYLGLDPDRKLTCQPSPFLGQLPSEGNKEQQEPGLLP